MQLGLSSCAVCGTGQLGVLRLPVMQNIGGFQRERSDPEWDAEANVLFLVQVECDVCGHVLLFNSERLEPSSTKSLVLGLTQEEEDALPDDDPAGP
ncbi:hypothetical protein ACFVWG_33455 [Kribbella sp. NPDC058245]|uniref:hypothetical protein n=1 Tax=Kribbella sp. NPDC058245 TaxID=3346399 RepID=UPI0036DFD338